MHPCNAAHLHAAPGLQRAVRAAGTWGVGVGESLGAAGALLLPEPLALLGSLTCITQGVLDARQLAP